MEMRYLAHRITSRVEDTNKNAIPAQSWAGAGGGGDEDGCLLLEKRVFQGSSTVTNRVLRAELKSMEEHGVSSGLRHPCSPES